MNGSIEDLENWICGIVQSNGILNVQKLCRIMNDREFKFCHSLHDKYKDVDRRYDNQFVKQCNDCKFHYREVHKIVMKLIKKGRIKSDKRLFYDVVNDEGDIRYKGVGRRRDLFRFLYLDEELFKKKVLDQTLESYVEL